MTTAAKYRSFAITRSCGIGISFWSATTEPLCDCTADIVCNEVGAVQSPLRIQSFQYRDLTGNRGVCLRVPGALREAIAQEVEQMNLVTGRDQRWYDVSPDERRRRRPVNQDNGLTGAMNAVGDAIVKNKTVVGNKISHFDANRKGLSEETEARF